MNGMPSSINIPSSLLKTMEDHWQQLITIDTEFSSHQLEDVYSGEVGHCLFLFAYWKYTKCIDRKEALVHKIIKTIDRVSIQEFKPGFFQGTAGSLALLLTLLQKLDVPFSSDISSKIADKICNHTIVNINDISNGNAGTLLGIFHIMEHLQVFHQKLSPVASQLLNYLLLNVKYGIAGIFWDVTPYQSKCLCGFSHGNAGIAFVFSEIGRSLNNNFLIKIAKSAAANEDFYYQEDLKNWPDFRMSHNEISTLREKLLTNNLEAFNDIGDTKGWCHGLPGIALSRLSIKMSNNNITTAKQIKFLEIQLLNLIADWKIMKSNDLGMCHGLTGLLYILQFTSSSNSKIRNKQLIEDIHSYLLQECAGHNHFVSDHSFFTGSSGIYYYLLSQQKSIDIDFNVLAPQLGSREVGKLYFMNEMAFVMQSCKSLLGQYFSSEQIEALLNKKIIVFNKFSFDDLYRWLAKQILAVKDKALIDSLLFAIKDNGLNFRDLNGLYDYVKKDAYLVFDYQRLDQIMLSKNLRVIIPKGVYLIKGKKSKIVDDFEGRQSPVYLSITCNGSRMVHEVYGLTKLILEKTYQYQSLDELLTAVSANISDINGTDYIRKVIKEQICELVKIKAIIIFCTVSYTA